MFLDRGIDFLFLRMKYEDGDLRESMRKKWLPLPPPPLSIPWKATWNLLGQVELSAL